MTLYYLLTTDADVRRALAASWRQFYADRHNFLSTETGRGNLARALYGSGPPLPGGPLDWHVGRRMWVWQTVECPRTRLVTDGAPGGCIVLHTHRGDVHPIVTWAANATPITAPDDVTLADVGSRVTNLRYSDGRNNNQAGKRARLLLGQSVDGEQVNVTRQNAAFQAGAIVDAAGLPQRWRALV